MKKTITLLLCFLMVATTAFASPIYEYKTQEEIYSGITHTTYRRLYSDRNVKFDVIKADLNKKFLKLELLKSSKGADVLDTVKNLAETKNTVVASNADFFSVHKGNQGFSLGLEMEKGEILQSPVTPDEMAMGFIEENTLSLSYMTFNCKVIAPNGEELSVRHINKHTSYYGDLLLYTSDFNAKMSPAPGGEVVEMVVEDDKVKEFRRNLPSTEIPDNGYILTVSEGSSMFLANNFEVGDEVKIEITATPDIENTETAFGGGTMLIKDGEIAPITHNVSGYNPRTAIGTDKTGKIIYIVTVDGRQNLSKGATLEQLADLMLEIGCYNALNLDGGGSTNLVAKTPFNSSLHSINSPTENRKVINAVGITSSAYTSEPASVKLNVSQDMVFIDDSITFEARIFDKYLNPVWNEENATVTTTSGKVSDKTYYPSKGGDVTLTAAYKKFKDKKTIRVIDTVSAIKVNDTVNLKKNGTTQLKVQISDSDGNVCTVNNLANFKITSLNPEIATCSNKTITAKNTGVTHIKVEKDGVCSYIKVVVGSPSTTPYSDNFETINATYTSYPDEHAVASYKLSDEYKKSGKTSGKLTFDFTTEEYDDTMAAYMVFDSIRMSDNTKSLSFDMYSEEAFDELLVKIQFTDGKGNKAYRLTPLEGIQEGWQTVEAIIPDDAIFPLYLTRIYVVQEKTENKVKGSLYFDDLKVNLSQEAQININKSFNKTDTEGYGLEKDGISFKIAGVTDNPTSIFDKVAYQNLLKSVSSADMYALLGKFNYKEAHASYAPIDTHSFSHFTKKNADFITLSSKDGSIRSSSSKQWTELENALKKSNEDNLFILINGSLDTESFEGEVFIDLLKETDKNVYVITNSTQNSLFKHGKVHIFEICDTSDGVNLEDKFASANILEFNISDKITFEFKKLWN